MNLACSTTYLRIGLVAPIVALLLSPQPPFLAVALLTALAGLSDALDGYLARRCKQETTYGAALDLIADKLLMLGVVTTLATMGAMPPWVPSLLLLREAAVSILRIRGAANGLFLAPDLWGKLKTALFLVALVGLLAGKGLGHGTPSLTAQAVSAASWWLLLAALGLSLASAANYALRWLGPWRMNSLTGSLREERSPYHSPL